MVIVSAEVLSIVFVAVACVSFAVVLYQLFFTNERQ